MKPRGNLAQCRIVRVLSAFSLDPGNFPLLLGVLFGSGNQITLRPLRFSRSISDCTPSSGASCSLLAFGGLENVLQKLVFNHTSFVSGFVFITLGTFCGAMLLLVRRSWRVQILTNSKHAPAPTSAWYFLNRFLAGFGSFLIFYAISLTHPAVVDAIGGVRYAIVFLGGFAFTKMRPAILRENFAGCVRIGKSAATAWWPSGLFFSRSIILVCRGSAGPRAWPPGRHDRAQVAEDWAGCAQGNRQQEWPMQIAGCSTCIRRVPRIGVSSESV